MIDLKDIRLVDWLTMAAIIIGPIGAVLVSLWRESRRERNSRRLDTFRSLMATRQLVLSMEHARALNLIDVEFHADKKVRSAWRKYYEHLGITVAPSEVSRWVDDGQKLLVALLGQMAVAIGYSYEDLDLQKSYRPKAQVELEDAQIKAIKGVAEITDGRRPLYTAEWSGTVPH